MNATRSVQLREVAEFVRGVSFDKVDASYHEFAGGVPILRAGNIRDELATDEDLVWVPARYVSDLQLLRTGDLAICLSSGSASVVGKTALARNGWRGSVGAFCGIIRARPEIHPQYLALWFRGGQFRDWRDSIARGANIQNLRFSEIEVLKIPLPPLSEQERLAARLSEQMSAVERARAAAVERLAAAEALHAAYLRQVFEGTESKHWKTRPLGELLRRHNHIIHPGDRTGGDATFVGLEHIEANTGRRTGSLKINLGDLSGRKPTFLKGQIVYGYLRPYLNKVWIAEFDGCSSVDQFAFDVKQDIADTEFVAAFMRSETFLRRAAGVTTPGQLPRISIDEIAAVTIEVPAALVDQRRIAGELSRRLAEAERLAARIREEQAVIGALPAALLREAFGQAAPEEGPNGNAGGADE